MLIDDVTIKVQAGHGGKGGVYFNSNLMSLGADGRKGRKWRKCLCGRGVRLGRA